MSAIGDRACCWAPRSDASAALNALALELPEAVYRDVREIFTTLLTEFDRLADIERRVKEVEARPFLWINRDSAGVKKMAQTLLNGPPKS